jgi:rubrerythrin
MEVWKWQSSKQESIADFLHCASILEERAYLLYKSLADKVNLPLINSLMLHIAFDSRKHSVVLKAISESMAKPKKSNLKIAKRNSFLGELGR